MTHRENGGVGREQIPVILAVDDSPEIGSALEHDLLRRYSPDYVVIVEHSSDAGLRELRHLRDDGVRVALVIAGSRLRGSSGLEFLSEARQTHTEAKRMLLVTYGEGAWDISITRDMMLGRIDAYTTKPWASPEEFLYPAIGELLGEWATTHLPTYKLMRLVGQKDSTEAHQLRDMLQRNHVPYGYCDCESDEGAELLRENHLETHQLPAAIFQDGRVLVRPSHMNIAEALGAQTRATKAIFDVAIVGAGPAGLAASVYAASEGLRTVLLEQEALGGQAGTTSMIRNYLGFPRGISGQLLAQKAFQQLTMFGAETVFMNPAVGLTVDGSKRAVICRDGSAVTARTIVIATGVSYRRLGIPEVERLRGVGVFYGAGGSEAQAMRGKRVFIVGAGNSAGQAAVHLAKYASCATLVVRGETLASSMSDYLIRQIADQPKIDVRYKTEVKNALGGPSLEQLELANGTTGQVETIPADGLFILIGAAPHTDWLGSMLEKDDHGYIVTGRDLGRERQTGKTPDAWPLRRSPFLLEASVPGVFAAGDVRHLSMKRVASAVGEGSTAIALIHEYLREEEIAGGSNASRVRID